MGLMPIKPNPKNKSTLNPDFVTGLTEAEGSSFR